MKGKILIVPCCVLFFLISNIYGRDATFVYYIYKGAESILTFKSTNDLIRHLKDKEYMVKNGAIEFKEIGILKKGDAYLSFLFPKQSISSIVSHIGIVGKNWLETEMKIHENLGRYPRPKSFEYNLSGAVENKNLKINIKLSFNEDPSHDYESNKIIWFQVLFKLDKKYDFLKQRALFKFKLGNTAIKLNPGNKFNYSGNVGERIKSNWYGIKRKNILGSTGGNVHNPTFIKPDVSILFWYKQPNIAARISDPRAVPVPLWSRENLFKAEILMAEKKNKGKFADKISN